MVRRHRDDSGVCKEEPNLRRHSNGSHSPNRYDSSSHSQIRSNSIDGHQQIRQAVEASVGLGSIDPKHHRTSIEMHRRSLKQVNDNRTVNMSLEKWEL